MPELVEHTSVKAARILQSARVLLGQRGLRDVSVAEIANAAGVGKGTVYLYWPTKEDLLLGIFGREVLAFLDHITISLTGDPTLVQPRRLAPLLFRATLDNPWLRRMLAGELHLVAIPTPSQGRDYRTMTEASPGALCIAVLPILREHGLARSDRPLTAQAYSVHATMLGFHTAATARPDRTPLHVDHPELVLADTMSLLVEPAVAPEELAVITAAKDVCTAYRATHATLLDLLTLTMPKHVSGNDP